MQKRVLSFLMVLAMVFSLLPLGVVAVEETAETPAFTVTLQQAHNQSAGGQTAVDVYLQANLADQAVTGYQLNLSGVTLVDVVDATGNNNLQANDNTIVYVPNESEDYTIKVGTGRVLVATITVLEADLSGLTAEAEVTKADAADYEESVKVLSCGHDDIVWTPWNSTTTLPSESGSYYLASDVALEAAWGIDEGVDIRLCLNGHTITQTADARVIGIVAGGKLSIYDCSDDVNAGGTITGGKAEIGAGVWVAGEFNLYGGTISGNTSTSHGSAIYAQGSAVVNISNAVISGNTAGAAGAVYVADDAQLTITDASITGNTSTSANASAWHTAGVYHVSTKPLTVSGTVVIDGNDSPANVPDVLLTKVSSDTLYVDELQDGTRITFKTMYTAATAASEIIAIAEGGSQTDWDCDWVTYVDKDNAVKNVSYIADGDSKVFTLGHWHVDADGVQHEYTAMSSLKALGAAEVGTYYYLTQDVAVPANTAYAVFGGADVHICLNGHTVTQKTAAKRIFTLMNYADGDGNLTIEDCTAYYDEVTGEYVSGGLTHTGASITKGSIVNVGAGSTFTLNGGKIYDSYDKGIGGSAVYVTAGSSFTMNGGAFCGNTAVNGGALFVEGGTDATAAVVDINGGYFYDNATVTGDGGAIYIGGTADVEISGTVFKNNTSDDDAGAIRLMDTGLTVENCTFVNNTSERYGGAIYATGANATLTVGTTEFTGNAAAEAGGAITATTSANVTISSTAITGNTANVGSAMVLSGKACATLDSCTVENNNALVDQGAVAVGSSSGVSTLVLKGENTIYNNTINGEGQHNVYVYQNESLLDAVDVTGGKVGVTLADQRLANELLHFTSDLGTSDPSAYFVSDDDAYQVVKFNNRLYLAGAVVVDKAAGTETLKASAQDAVTVVTGDANAYAKLLIDAGEVVTTGDAYLDLNGYDVDSVEIGQGATLYAFDTTTDDYDCSDGYGVIKSISYTAAAEGAEDNKGSYEVYQDNNTLTGARKRYVAIAESENTNVSFHRVYLAINNKVLRTAYNGEGFMGIFAGDQAVKENITEYGISITTDQGKEAGKDVRVGFIGSDAFMAGRTGNTPNRKVVVLTNVLNAAYGAANETYAGMTIYGTPYMKVGGVEIVGNEIETTMNELIGSALNSNKASAVNMMLTNCQVSYENGAVVATTK